VLLIYLEMSLPTFDTYLRCIYRDVEMYQFYAFIFEEESEIITFILLFEKVRIKHLKISTLRGKLFL
jgi:hypothetical protein